MHDHHAVHRVPLGFHELGDPRFRHGRALEFALQGTLELQQMPIAFDPPQAWFDGQQCAGDPALFLIRRPPAIHLVRQLPELGVERFQTVRGLQAEAHGDKHPEAMKRQGFLESLVQAGRGGKVHRPQFLPQPTAPAGLLALGQIPHHILPLMPLAPLHGRLQTEDRLDRLAQPLRAVDDTEQPPLRPQSPFHQLPARTPHTPVRSR